MFTRERKIEIKTKEAIDLDDKSYEISVLLMRKAIEIVRSSK